MPEQARDRGVGVSDDPHLGLASQRGQHRSLPAPPRP
jgi:hypothetical protein